MTSINVHIFCFCFAEQLASFWSIFEKRIPSDPQLYTTLDYLYKRNIISNAEIVVIDNLSNVQFLYHLVFHLVRASATSGVNNITSFTTFLLHNHHYRTLYKQWVQLGKKMSLTQVILYMK